MLNMLAYCMSLSQMFRRGKDDVPEHLACGEHHRPERGLKRVSARHLQLSLEQNV